MKIVTREIVREIDRKTIRNFGIPGLILMENAGRAVSNVILRKYPAANKISVFCGGGNNGGDGFVIARHLICAGKEVNTYLLRNKNEYRGDAKTNLNSLSKISKNIKRVKSDLSNYKKSDVIVDAIFGTGLESEVRGSYKKIIERINSLKTPKVSVDLPSGIDSNKGTPLGVSIKANITVTFIVPKLGISIYPGLNFSGEIYVADITTPKILEGEIPFELLTFKKCRSVIRERPSDTHKGSYGHTLIIAGSAGKTGAAALSAHSAVRSGSGLVTVGVPRSIMSSVDEKIVEAMSEGFEDNGKAVFTEDSLDQALASMKTKTSLAIGPGISDNKHTEAFLLGLLRKTRIPVVADADAINIIARNIQVLKQMKVPIILTPHPGEMGRLTGTTSKEIQKSRVDYARDFTIKNRCYLILKGARSLIATPEGRVYINPTGNPGMSSGGMGDILTGVISGLLSQKYSPEEACTLGTFIHGLAGDIMAEIIGKSGITATDVADSVPLALSRVTVTEKEPFFEIIR